jgi:tetratricopeptide (TPR) repeat protein
MNLHPNRTTHARERGGARPGPGLLLVAALLAAGMPLAGCSMNVLGRRSDVTAKPAASAKAEKPAKAPKKPRAARPDQVAKAEPAGKPAKAGKSEKRGKDDEPRAARRGTIAEAIERSAALPAEPYWPFRQAELYAAADSSGAVEPALERALTRDPRYTPALAMLSARWFTQGRHAEAIQRLEAVRAASPSTFPDALIAGLALHYDAVDRPDVAAQLAAGIAKPDLDVTGSSLVFLQLRGAAPDSAKALAEATLDRDGKTAANYNNAGIVRLRAGDPESARKAFLKAIDMDPDLPGPYYNLAILDRFYRFDDASAARWYDLYTRRSHDDPDGLAQLFRAAETKPVAERKDER